MEEFAKTYVPLISALISLVSISIAFMTLRDSRRERREKQREAEQEGLLAALRGEKEAVGFMALQLAHEPQSINDSNRNRLLSALCLAFVFEASSRARALVLKTLRKFSADNSMHDHITGILEEVEADFRAYESEIGPEELKKYLERIGKLKSSLRPSATQETLNAGQS